MMPRFQGNKGWLRFSAGNVRDVSLEQLPPHYRRAQLQEEEATARSWMQRLASQVERRIKLTL